jgi:hypothetical protein
MIATGVLVVMAGIGVSFSSLIGVNIYAGAPGVK